MLAFIFHAISPKIGVQTSICGCIMYNAVSEIILVSLLVHKKRGTQLSSVLISVHLKLIFFNIHVLFILLQVTLDFILDFQQG